jgi:hypothetical protein
VQNYWKSSLQFDKEFSKFDIETDRINNLIQRTAMLQENIEKFYCKVGIVPRHKGEVHIRMKNGKSLVGTMPAQNELNLKNNLWDFGLSSCPLVDGEEITAIVLWDRIYTRKYTDEFPEGVITGKSETSRTSRPSIY